MSFENCINGDIRSFSKSEAKTFLILYSPFENSTTRIAITHICTHSYITLTVVAKKLSDKSGCQLWLNLAWAGLAVLFCRQMDFSNFSGLRSFFKMETNARTFEALFLSNTLRIDILATKSMISYDVMIYLKILSCKLHCIQ